MSSFAVWLDTALSGFDGAILAFLHSLASGAGIILTPLAKFITLIGEKGILFFLLAAVLMLFKKTRIAGVCIFGAVCCGALITSIALKDIVARARPFETSALFREWWTFVGSPFEDGFSFPSGHVTAATAGVFALCLTRGKKFAIPGALFILLMALSRNYLMAHYPTDVIAGFIVGAASAYIAYFITLIIFAVLEKYKKKSAFCKFLLNFDVYALFKK